MASLDALSQPPNAGAPSNAALVALSQNQQQTAALAQREQQEMAPAIAGAQGALNAPKPAAPQIPKPPAAPQSASDMSQPSLAFLSAANLLAGIAGAFSRQHVTSALTAFGGAVKGFKTGQVQVAEQKFKDWEAASKQATEAARQVADEYKAVMDDRKLTIDEQMAQVQLIATKYKDSIVMQAAEAKNLTLVAQIIERQNAAIDKYQNAVELLEQKHQNALDELERKLDAKYSGLNTVEGIEKFAADYAKMSPQQQQTIQQVMNMTHPNVMGQVMSTLAGGGAGGAGGAAATPGAKPKVGDIVTAPDGSKHRVTGFDQDGTPVGVPAQ